MANTVKPFQFRQCINIPKSTGYKANSLKQLRDLISLVSDESIYHHTYQYFLKGNLLEYTSDFAQWVGESLEDRALSEQLSNIDPYEYSNISALRKVLMNVIDSYLKNFPEPRDALPGSEFYFLETSAIIFNSGVVARNLAEFMIAIQHVDPASIYFHFFEARSRLGQSVDDFSKWVEEVLGKDDLAEKIRAIDLFMHNIDGIREHLEELITEEVKKDMDSIGQAEQ